MASADPPNHEPRYVIATDPVADDGRRASLDHHPQFDRCHISFHTYERAVDDLMGTSRQDLRGATEVFMARGGATAEAAADLSTTEDLAGPHLVELIWSFWLEEGRTHRDDEGNQPALPEQTPSGFFHAPLADLEIDPLRPLNNLFWGYIQDEQHRLSVVRRGYEYDHHYGLRLYGKAVPELRPADSRSKFF